VILARTFFCFILLTSGCVSVGRTSHGAYDLSGEVFPENPASVVPYFTGLLLGAVASAPLLLVSWPGTTIAYPESGDDEDKIWSTLSPVAMTGSVVGSIFGAIFYPFGMPFMDAQGTADDWDEDADDWGREDNFEAGPPGGEDDPIPAPWLRAAAEIPGQDGIPGAPFRRTPVTPWEDYRPER
jgi:hypothetical protein